MKREEIGTSVFDRAGKLELQLIVRIDQAAKGLVNRFPPGQYIAYLDRYPLTAHYRYVSPEVREWCAGIVQKSSEKVLELYQQLVLVKLIAGARQHWRMQKLPPDVQALTWVNFQRIVKKIDNGRAKPGYYLYSEEKFHKDLGMCRLTMIPVGAQKVHVGRMPRGFLLKNGWRQFFRGLALVLFETRGFQPVYRMHTDSRDRDLMKEFNPDGWVRFFRRAAELLKVNKNIKGLCGSSWFFDPRLKEISPELAYLHEMVLDAGGFLFYQGTSEGTVRDATFMSPGRIRLHKEGKYQPVSYVMVFPRKRLIKWAEIALKIAQ